MTKEVSLLSRFRSAHWTLSISVLLLSILQANYAAAEDADGGRLYITREERREERLKHPLTDWASVSALLEVEQSAARSANSEHSSRWGSTDPVATLQLSSEVKPVSWLKAEVIYEFDANSQLLALDEASTAIEANSLELEMGTLYLPFGAFYSHFATGPLLEFGETRGKAVTLNWDPDEHLELILFAYQASAKHFELSGPNLGWGAAVNVSPSKSMNLGVSFASNLAYPIEEMLENTNDRNSLRVAGLNGHCVFDFEEVEFSLEFLQTLGSYSEVLAEQNSPWAWNTEAALDLTDSLEFAVRQEGSGELTTAPRYRSGAAFTWRINKNAGLTVEYFYNIFRSTLPSDSKDSSSKPSQEVGAKLSVQF